MRKAVVLLSMLFVPSPALKSLAAMYASGIVHCAEP